MWNLLRLALDLTVRNTASTKMLAFWTQSLTWVGFDTASIKMFSFWTQNLTGVGFEPTHTFVYRSLKGEFLESGALDRSAILPWVYRTCFILSSITPPCNVESVCVACHLTLRTPASIKMFAFWTQNLTGVGFEPTHTFVYQKSQRRIFWVWRLRPLGHPALSISHLLHPVFDNTFL